MPSFPMESEIFDKIKGFQGFSPKPTQNAKGIWQIGYGHIIQKNDGLNINSMISMSQANAFLEDDFLKVKEDMIDQG